MLRVPHMHTDVIKSYLSTVPRDVFSTMLGWEVEPKEVPVDPACNSRLELRGINGSIGFGGKMTATLFVSADESLARRMAQQVLGDPALESMHEICDVFGEITNMVAGGCKSRLCDNGMPVVMSIPNVIRGRALSATGRDVRFLVRVDFVVSASREEFSVVLFGKFE